ncbi:MFS aflatoxin efflux pump [Pyrenophora seminiperda CCB06]|uniref:MFS aflatoxin efflux pump n=1 Tax=Pyrenophora seminiperda CCB06 TaxID=1302712 RepID=A0A3M7LV64_9PLEO|nr:MFS aflatoxin efflux pump [Pyrenophora seminiperda CCB06]
MAIPPTIRLVRADERPQSVVSAISAAISSRTFSDRGSTQGGTGSLISYDERNLIADLIADLSANCETAFSRSYTPGGGTFSYSSYNFSQDDLAGLRNIPPRREVASSYTARNLRDDLQEIRPYLRDSTILALEGILALDIMGPRDLRPRTAELTRYNYMPEVPEMPEMPEMPEELMDSYQSSKRSSFSSPASVKFQDDMNGSNYSLPQKPKGTRNNRKSQLRESQLPDEGDGLDDTAPGADIGRQPMLPTATAEYPSTAKTAIIMVSLYISIFLVALDRTIMGPAIPAITNEFHSLDDIGWYGSAYMLTAAGFILLYGRIYTFFRTKPVFLSGIFLFELGSLICGAAQNSLMLIVGRAIAGLGSSGIFTGAILIMLNTVPLEKRPLLQALFGACFGVASVAGPLLGGAFTGSKATWRWCFYINLPLGGVTIVVVWFLLKLEEQKPKLKNWKETLKNLDPLGTALFLPSITCLLLALEWGAAEYPWSSPRIIALLTVFALLLVLFVLWQYLTRNTTATVPARIVLQRSVFFGGASQFCVGATMLTVSIYIPLWFQAIKGASAMQSGVNTIPLVLSVVLGSIMSGALVQRLGYYTPFMIIGSGLMAVGTGLITTWNMNTGTGVWIGYQILVGFGVGCTMQHPNIAVQTVLPKPDVPIGTAFLSLCQTLGGAVFAAVGQNLYIDKFSAGLERIGGLDPERILNGGATDLTKGQPEAVKGLILAAYNNSLTQGTFFAALIVACLAVPAAIGMEWKSVKAKRPPQDEEKQGGPNRAPSVPRGILKTPNNNSMSRHSLLKLPTPPPILSKTYRSSGNFSSYLTAKINPDLRDSLMPGR